MTPSKPQKPMKIALISLVEDQYWQSCYIITNGLRDAYLNLSLHYEVRDWRVSKFNSAEAVHKMAGEIAASDVDLVVFLDTSPLYGLILNKLRKSESRHPRLRFHVYGDFTMRAYLWSSWESDLRLFQTEWVCASTRQVKMVSLLTQTSNWVCPFPVSKTGFHFNQVARLKIRKKLGFRTNDFVIYYSGRLALQKNVLAILQMASQLQPNLRSRAHFVFAGDFDDRGAPFEGMSLLSGEMYCLWQNELAKLPRSLRGRVHLLGSLDHDSLQATYAAADCFLSLSLQHDEDFGMSPAEAALAGLPMVLTRWGGYADFQDFGAQTELINVQLNEKGPSFDLADVSSAVEKVAARPLSENQRRKRGRSVASHLSVAAVAKLIEARTPLAPAPQPRFENFSPLMKDLSTYFDETRHHLIYPDCTKGSTYEKIYRHYI